MYVYMYPIWIIGYGTYARAYAFLLSIPICVFCQDAIVADPIMIILFSAMVSVGTQNVHADKFHPKRAKILRTIAQLGIIE
jgi:hypothetical protein